MKYGLVMFSCLALIAFMGCLSQSEPQPSMQENKTQNQSIDYTWYSSPLYLLYYPRSWHLEEPQPGAVIVSSPPDNRTNVVNQFVLEVWAGNESSPQEFENYERSLMQNYTVIGKKSIQFKGKDAFAIELEGETDGAAFVYKTIFFRNGEWVYRLSYAIDKTKVDIYKPIMETILDKFVIGSY